MSATLSRGRKTPVTGGTARAAPSPARRAGPRARSLAGRPPACPPGWLPPPPLPKQHGREGAEAAPAETRAPHPTRARGTPAPPLSPPRGRRPLRARAIYSRVQPAPPRPRWRRGAGPAARGSRAGLAGEARANPTGGGAPGCSMACCPPPPPGSSSSVGSGRVSLLRRGATNGWCELVPNST